MPNFGLFITTIRTLLYDRNQSQSAAPHERAMMNDHAGKSRYATQTLPELCSSPARSAVKCLPQTDSGCARNSPAL